MKTTRSTPLSRAALLLTGAVFFIPSGVTATVVSMDFNDIDTTASNKISGKAGGIGTTGAWANSLSTAASLMTLNNIDLTAPAATNYAIPAQTGSAHSAQMPAAVATTATARIVGRNLSTTMTGEIWFSALMNLPGDDSRAGLDFNVGTTATNTRLPRLVFLGDGAGGISGVLGLSSQSTAVTLPGLAPATTFLVVGHLHIGTGTLSESLDVWVNPDVSLGFANLGPVTLTLTQDTSTNAPPASFNLDSGLTRIGVESYKGTAANPGGIVDSIFLSDNPDTNQAFADVTGVLVPEPSAAMLAGLGALAGMRRRRR
jgi:hypothetical protein